MSFRPHPLGRPNRLRLDKYYPSSIQERPLKLPNPRENLKSKSMESENRSMLEDEVEALRELMRLGDLVWDDGEHFAKSGLWQKGLEWVPTTAMKEKKEYGGGEEDDVEELSGKSIYLLVMYTEQPNRGSWYTVKDWLAKGKAREAEASSCEVLSPIPDLEGCDLQRAVAFPFPPGSRRIVSLGGSYLGLPVPPEAEGAGTRVRSYDLATREWKELPSMWAERDFPTVLVDEGKLYVFGGLRGILHPGEDCFIEVYDPKDDKWEAVSFGGEEIEDMPPLYRHIPGGLFVDGEGNRHLLFHSDPRVDMTTLYTYNLETCAVNFAETPVPDVYNGAVVVDNTLYAYLEHTGDLRAYDLSTKKWIYGPVRGLLDMEWSRTISLKHICGKYLCLMYRDDRPRTLAGDIDLLPHRDYSLRFVVTVFKLVRQMVAEIVDSRSFMFPGGSFVSECIFI